MQPKRDPRFRLTLLPVRHAQMLGGEVDDRLVGEVPLEAVSIMNAWMWSMYVSGNEHVNQCEATKLVESVVAKLDTL